MKWVTELAQDEFPQRSFFVPGQWSINDKSHLDLTQTVLYDLILPDRSDLGISLSSEQREMGFSGRVSQNVSGAPHDTSDYWQPATAGAGISFLGIITDLISDKRHDEVVKAGNHNLANLSWFARSPVFTQYF